MKPFFKVPKLRFVALFLLCLFIFIFPKGGIKLSENPVTIGYSLALLFSLFLALKKFSFQNSSLLKCGLVLFFFQAASAFSICMNSFESSGVLTSLILHFYIFPLIVFFALPQAISNRTLQIVQKWIKHGVFFLSAFGIFLFFYKMLTGKFLEIPFLTVNYHDVNTLETTKCIDRGRFFKLISTYNNGNLFGVCLLMLYPLFHKLEKSPLKKIVVILSLIMTLSRTVWIGALAALFFELFSKEKRQSIGKNLIPFLLVIGFILVLTISMKFKLNFFLDKTLGNRIDQFEVLKSLSILGDKPFEGIHEITFLGIYRSFGLIGLISFYLGLLYPIYLMLKPNIYENPLQKRAAFGLLLYHFISLSDGALIFIPVMALYWSLCYFGLSKPIKNQVFSTASSE